MAISLQPPRARPMKHMMLPPRTAAAQTLMRHIGAPQSVEIHWGVVQSIQTSPNSLTLNIGGSADATPGIRYLASYTPTVGDTVMILRSSGHNRTPSVNSPQKAGKQAHDQIVIGKLA